jgi:hypothetical protein
MFYTFHSLLYLKQDLSWLPAEITSFSMEFDISAASEFPDICPFSFIIDSISPPVLI